MIHAILSQKSMKPQVPLKKNVRSFNAFDHKNTSGKNLRNFLPTAFKKALYILSKTPRIKLCVKK